MTLFEGGKSLQRWTRSYSYCWHAWLL